MSADVAGRFDIQPVLELTALHVLDGLSHVGVVRVALGGNGEEDFFILYSGIIDFSIKTVIFCQAGDNGCKKKVGVFVEFFVFQFRHMVAGNGFVGMIKNRTNTSAVGNGERFFDDSCIFSVFYESIKAIVKSSRGNIRCYTFDVFLFF